MLMIATTRGKKSDFADKTYDGFDSTLPAIEIGATDKNYRPPSVKLASP